MENAGSALMGIGYGSGENRGIDAARSAIESPLLELSINGAKGLLLNITGGSDLSMFEVDEASRLIKELCDPNANIIFGTSIDERYTGEIKVTVIATGFSEETNAQLSNMSRNAFGTNRGFQTNTMAPSPRPQNTFFGANNTQNPTQHPQQQEIQNDYDVPAFLRNKLGK
jgi:cell division protein FtsZ